MIGLGLGIFELSYAILCATAAGIGEPPGSDAPSLVRRELWVTGA
jgi:hypothetical protein